MKRAIIPFYDDMLLFIPYSRYERLYIYWCYSTFYMLTFSYRVYMGFIGYLCAYIPNRKGREKEENTKSRRRTPAERKEEQKKEA